MAPGSIGHFIAEQRLERLCQLRLDVVFVHVDVSEKRLVQEAALLRGGAHVRLVAVGGVVECHSQASLELVRFNVCGRQPCLDSAELPGDTVLLRLEQIEWYGTGVVRLE
ncbi:hypothetical protein [Mycolicibacterium agri]|uniref:hypothetical protein n=1 Tax=Mycolicibacterium agri TaxID=36811 RepID=UPI0013D42113|nr:hypothetical protein [Mycolicibacterium agri]